jgi:DNA ligase-1
MRYIETMSQTVIDILEELESTPGSNAKKDILEAAHKNSLLRRVFIAAFDPYKVYYVSKVKTPKSRTISDAESDDEVVDGFITGLNVSLATRQLTGNAAKEWVVEQLAGMSDLQQKWCLRILLRNLRCGVQASTVNKVWPGSINPFEVALACTLKSDFVKGEGIKILDKVTYPVRVEPKLDGLRLIALKKEGVVTFYTRNGTLIEGLPLIREALEGAPYDDIVLDAECMGRDWNESASVVMSGRTADKSKQKNDSNMVLNVFDAMSFNEWVTQTSTLSYAERTELVATVVRAVWSSHSQKDNAPVCQVAHITVHNETELKVYFAKCMNDGYEGVMIKRMDTTYEWDRSKNILKLKPVVTYEGVITDWYEGRRGTKREGLFGGFNVILPNGVITRLGGGFNDAVRAQVQLEGPDTWVGKIVEIKAQPDPMTKDGLTEEGKARFPVYMRIRDAADVDPKVLQTFETWKNSDTH